MVSPEQHLPSQPGRLWCVLPQNAASHGWGDLLSPCLSKAVCSALGLGHRRDSGVRTP